MTPPAPTSSFPKAIAIILARAGSKGVPGKNTRVIAGKPCIAWTIAHAQAASSVGLIAVSSDDAHARGIAAASGVIALERSPALATDTARIDDAAREAVLQLASRGLVQGSPPIVILYANVPLRPVGLVDRTVELLLSSKCDSVQSYQPVGKYHPWWTARLDDSGAVRPWEGDVLNHNTYRRQDLPPAYIPDGAIIALTRRALFGEVPNVPPGPHAFFGKDRRGIINPEGSVVDIDSEIDVVVAEQVLKPTKSER